MTDAPPLLPSMCRTGRASMLDQITPLILTYNELPNIERTLAKLAWAKRIVVIDSGSTDGTLDILRRDPRIAVFVHEFVDFAGQCNFGLVHVESPWVLSLDADYELSDELVDELRTLDAGRDHRRLSRQVRLSHSRPSAARNPVPAENNPLSQGSRRTIGRKGMRTGSASMAMSCRCAASSITTIASRCRAGWPHSSVMPPTKPTISSTQSERTGRSLARADRIRLMGWPAPIAVLLYVLFVKALHPRRLARMVLRAAAAVRRDIAGARNRRSPNPSRCRPGRKRS